MNHKNYVTCMMNMTCVAVGVRDLKRRGIDLLKRISQEPWWNKRANVTVTECIGQITKLLPRAVGKLHRTLLDYLSEIHS